VLAVPYYVPVIVAGGLAAGTVLLTAVIWTRRTREVRPPLPLSLVLIAGLSSSALVGLLLLLPRNVSFGVLLVALLSFTGILIFEGARPGGRSERQQLRLWLVIAGGVLSILIWVAAELR